MLSVPRARDGGNADAADARRLLHSTEPATESESESERETSRSCRRIPLAGGGSPGAPLYTDGLSRIEARRCGLGAPLASHKIETSIASAVAPPISKFRIQSLEECQPRYGTREIFLCALTWSMWRCAQAQRAVEVACSPPRKLHAVLEACNCVCPLGRPSSRALVCVAKPLDKASWQK